MIEQQQRMFEEQQRKLAELHEFQLMNANNMNLVKTAEEQNQLNIIMGNYFHYFYYYYLSSFS